MTEAEFIGKLGKAEELAAAFAKVARFELSRSAIYEWKRNGIPARYRKFLVEIAHDKGVALPRAFSGTNKRKERAA